MVNTGKPSPGCQTCKTRRIRCDLQRPDCRRCTSTGRSCPGVPTEGFSSFIDQNKYALTLKRRSKKATKSPVDVQQQTDEVVGLPSSQDPCVATTSLVKHSQPHLGHVCAGCKFDDLVPFNTASPLSLHLVPGIEDVATSFFFQHYAVQRASPVIDCLRQLYYSSQIKSNPAVDNIVAAVALSSFAHFPDMTHAHNDAAIRYDRAVGFLARSLNDPAKAKSNTTLLCVILMGMYERIAMTEESPRSISRHGSGAVALVRNTGRPKDINSMAYRLFTVVRGTVILECAAKSIALDAQDICDFWFTEAVEDMDPASRVSMHGAPIGELRQRAIRLFETGDRRPSRDQVSLLLADARVVDTQLLHWVQALPFDWHFTSKVRTDLIGSDTRAEDSQAWCGVVHEYNDVWTACITNNYRVLRIFVQSVIARCLSYLERRPEPTSMPTGFLYRAAMHTVRALVDDIAASVHAHIGDIADTTKVVDFLRIRHLKAHEALGAFYIMKPLWIACAVEGIDEDLKAWMRARLGFIGVEYSLRQALILRESKAVIPMTWDPMEWDHDFPGVVLAI